MAEHSAEYEDSSPTSENVSEWLICLIFVHRFDVQTAALKPAYQTLLSFDKHLAPDDLCLSVCSPHPARWAAGSSRGEHDGVIGESAVGVAGRGRPLARVRPQLSCPQQHLVVLTSSQPPGGKLLRKREEQMTDVLY